MDDMTSTETPVVECNDVPQPNQILVSAQHIGYGVVVPVICFFGLCTNCVNLVVLTRPEMKETIFTYLTSLAAADLVTVTMMMFSSLYRGLGIKSYGWLVFDIYVHLPIAIISSSTGTLLIVAITFERCFYVKWPTVAKRFSRKSTAKRVVTVIVLSSLLFHIPFCFSMKVDKNSVEIQATKFNKSSGFLVYNWIRLSLFGFIPAFLIAVINSILIYAVRQMKKLRHKLIAQRQLAEDRRQGEQIRLTITLIAITCMFYIGELPSNIFSRKTATHILFGGNKCMMHSQFYKIMSLIINILVTLQYTLNFVFYCALNKKFMNVLRKVCPGTRRKKRASYRQSYYSSGIPTIAQARQ
ncbi:probable G-protein coupled receptor B0563.6 [Limulus polyphemus]|uniref:Probable G-protein coupled receptor B0563.6 n=1 Tax=Limulus polyphemus TaxID=6850 RepID=A0ABM1SEX0_LIMPO|nr:probable G-protein coupled receptor B0563.6 [Limulus polyphemus]XP_022242176.1 probable G-protein coupled receptor B0563.6 [Limulus polyphemus]